MKNLRLAMPSLKDAKMRQKLPIKRIEYTLEKEYSGLGSGKTYYICTYGCQGNEADSEVMAGILEDMGYTHGDSPYTSSVVILNTCAIRETAENRIWGV